MRNKDVICGNCGEFIGEIDKLDTCPICGQSLHDDSDFEDTKDEDEEDCCD
jgi:rubrerythrin